MRPTIDEQLAGAQRFLDAVARDESLSAESEELLGNAGRLLSKVAASWSQLLPFFVADNQAMTTLLSRLSRVMPELSHDIDATTGTDPGPPGSDITAAADRNAELRSLLARVIRSLPRSDAGLAARSDIGDYLRQRVATDPT